MTRIQCCEMYCTAAARYITLVRVDDKDRKDKDPSLALCREHAGIIWPLLIKERPPVGDLAAPYSVDLEPELVRRVMDVTVFRSLKEMIDRYEALSDPDVTADRSNSEAWPQGEDSGIGGSREP